MKKIILSLLAISSVVYAGHKKETKKVVVSKEVVSDESCKIFQAQKPGLNGFALSAVGGMLSVDTKIQNDTTGFNLSYKTTYKRIGLGLTYYMTTENNVVYGFGLDLLSEFGAKKVNAQGTIKVLPVDPLGRPFGLPMNRAVDITYKQKRPLTANLYFKLGYAYGDFIPYVSLGVRESYIRHEITPVGQKKHIEKDVNFGFAPGAGFMYKVGNFGFGMDYSYHKESTFGLEGYADNDEQVKNKGGHSVMGRISYFF